LDHSIADIGAHPHLLLPQALDRSQLPGAQLLPAWPNPFNPSTRLRFELPETARVSIRIFDISGRETAQLANAIYPSGIHEITWHAHAVSSGTYFALLESGSTHSIQKLLLLK
jgi:hypothetical protein